jgi:transcriptional regulator with XRE-family HTH domain
MSTREDPSRQRRRLRVELRRVRDAAGLTQRQAAERLEWSLSKLIRIEAGTVGVSVTDLRAMLQLYGVTKQSLVDSLTEAARGSKGQSWWTQYRESITPQFAQYLGQEGSATSIRVFHPFLIPGLLHTEEYAFELQRVHDEGAPTRRAVALRMERQRKLLGRDKPPQVAFVLGQEALYRWIGGPAVMGRQLHRLLEVMSEPGRPGASVQIVPFSAGSYAGTLGSFVLLGFDSGEDLLFAEGAGGELVSRDDQEKIGRFTEYFDMMRDLVLPGDRARALVEERISELEEAAGSAAAESGLERPRSAPQLDRPGSRSDLADLRDVPCRSQKVDEGRVSSPAATRNPAPPNRARLSR